MDGFMGACVHAFGAAKKPAAKVSPPKGDAKKASSGSRNETLLFTHA